MAQEPETRYRLFRNLFKGLLWLAVIIAVFILSKEYIHTTFQKDIEALHQPFVVYTVFFVSEVIFGLIPPEFFMMLWILHGVTVMQYVINLTILTLISYGAGIIGYYIGKFFSKAPFYKRISERYLEQYQDRLKRYGGYIVFVGAVTPIPFSATCMLAGSVDLPLKNFLLICITRIVRFAAYGWMVWSFPSWFSA